CTCAWPVEWSSDEGASGAVAPAPAAAGRRGAHADAAPVDAVGVVHDERGGERVAAAAAAGSRNARELPPALRTAEHRPESREAALPRPRVALEAPAGRARDPEPGRDAAALSDDEVARPRQHLRGGRDPGDGGNIRCVPREAVRARHP